MLHDTNLPQQVVVNADDIRIVLGLKSGTPEDLMDARSRLRDAVD